MGLGRYVIRRIIVGAVLIFFVLILTFIIIHAAPGGPESVYGDPSRLPPETIEQIRARFGLDKPLSGQFISYLGSVLRGDMGTSYFTGQPVTSTIADRIPATLLLMVPSMIIAIILGMLLGIYAAQKPYSKTDRFITAIGIAGYSMPAYWLGLLFLTIFTLWLGLFPSSGFATFGVELSIIDVIHHMVLPVTTLVICWLASFALFTRASLIEVQGLPFISAARAKGLPSRTVFYRHALRNALLPVVTIIGLFAAFILAGAIVIETVYTWPGLGLLFFRSVTRRDYPVLLGLFLVTAIMVVLMNLITDIVYGILDPRITYD